LTSSKGGVSLEKSSQDGLELNLLRSESAGEADFAKKILLSSFIDVKAKEIEKGTLSKDLKNRTTLKIVNTENYFINLKK
tara:strand:+ start:338 stop:577 length:240 start_codon:yes stop_codon:yes gene_type:complete